MQSVNFRYTEADLVDARASLYAVVPLVRVVRLMPPVLVAISLLAMAWLASRQDEEGAMEFVGWLFLGLVLWAWTFVGERWLLPRSVRKSLARDKGLQGDNTVAWDAERIVITASHGESRWPWGDFARWRESRGCLLLYQSDRLCNAIPKRCLDEAQLAEIQGYLAAAVGKPGKRRK